jgi:WbqC-like protein family
MKLAVMQPYFFPYIGYFQMVGNCDLFICYDTVSYIQRGWINRNRIIISKEIKYISVPVKKSKLKSPILEIEISDFENWKRKFLKTIEFSYKKAPFFDSTFNLLMNILNKKKYTFISDLSIESIKGVSKFLDFSTDFKSSSNLKESIKLDRETRLEYFIKQYEAEQIILPPGSFELYRDWNPNNCIVQTMEFPNIIYKQYRNKFKENLSIIDVLMFNSKEEIKNMVASISFI